VIVAVPSVSIPGESGAVQVMAAEVAPGTYVATTLVGALGAEVTTIGLVEKLLTLVRALAFVAVTANE
jgi:hypothetical protein